MMTHNADTAQTWRDLAEQLSPEAIKAYERTEQQFASADLSRAFPAEDPADVLERLRRNMLEDARIQARFGHIALPTGATGAESWQDGDDGEWTRLVHGPYQSTAHLGVGISGIQQTDGTVTWAMYVSTDDNETTPEQARRFAAQVVAIAEALEGLR